MFACDTNVVWREPDADRTACHLLAELCKTAAAGRRTANCERPYKMETETGYDRVREAVKDMPASYRDVYQLFLTADAGMPPEAKRTAAEVYRWSVKSQDTVGTSPSGGRRRALPRS